MQDEVTLKASILAKLRKKGFQNLCTNLNSMYCTNGNHPQVLCLNFFDPGIENHYQHYQLIGQTGYFGCHTG